MTNTAEIRPFRIDVPQAEIDDLRDRLSRTRWSEQVPGAGWERGVPVDYLKELAEYWAHVVRLARARGRAELVPAVHHRDRRADDPLPARPVEPTPDATPLLLIHGWPGRWSSSSTSIGPLTEPDAHGGTATRSTWSSRRSPATASPARSASTGWTHQRIAAAFAELMAPARLRPVRRPGRRRRRVPGARWSARLAPEHVIGVHVNALVTFPSATGRARPRSERAGGWPGSSTSRTSRWATCNLQGTRPQTLAYGLHDSPVGQLAWIVEKFKEWTDSAAELPEDAVDRDHLLTDVSIYWFTGTAGSSANLYYETYHDPVGVHAERARHRADRRRGVDDPGRRHPQLAERDHNVVHWTEFERGGHFLALENPVEFVDDVRAFFREVK